jgi:hypothetical protein
MDSRKRRRLGLDASTMYKDCRLWWRKRNGSSPTYRIFGVDVITFVDLQNWRSDFGQVLGWRWAWCMRRNGPLWAQGSDEAHGVLGSPQDRGLVTGAIYDDPFIKWPRLFLP